MRHHRSTLARRGALAAALALTAIPASAQTAAQTVQVLELDYAPTSANAALDVRPGPYLLSLRGAASGPYVGTLRGPNNEVLSEGFPVTATGCTGTLTGTTRLTTTVFPGKTHLNQLGALVAVGTNCQLSFSMESLGLSNLAADLDPVPRACPTGGGSEPAEVNRIVSQKVAKPKAQPTGAQACSEVPWPPVTITADLEPAPAFGFAGQNVAWRKTITVSATQAQARSNGRCFFPWAMDTHNAGDGASSTTGIAILTGSSLGLQLGSSTLPAIPAGAVAPASGMIGLPSGRWRVFARIDPANQTLESNGGNNIDWIIVNVVGRCAP